ncbi:hypothetical protein MRX96_057241 [Rhipicephalus microplus]
MCWNGPNLGNIFTQPGSTSLYAASLSSQILLRFCAFTGRLRSSKTRDKSLETVLLYSLLEPSLTANVCS